MLWLSATTPLGGAVGPPLPVQASLHTSTGPGRPLYLVWCPVWKAPSLATCHFRVVLIAANQVASVLCRRSPKDSEQARHRAPHTAACTAEPQAAAQCDWQTLWRHFLEALWKQVNKWIVRNSFFNVVCEIFFQLLWLNKWIDKLTVDCHRKANMTRPSLIR